MVPKAQICNTKLTVKESKLWLRGGVREVLSFPHLRPFLGFPNSVFSDDIVSTLLFPFASMEGGALPLKQTAAIVDLVLSLTDIWCSTMKVWGN